MSSLSVSEDTFLKPSEQGEPAELVLTVQGANGSIRLASIRLDTAAGLLKNFVGLTLQEPQKRSLEVSNAAQVRIKENRRIGRSLSKALRVTGAKGKERRSKLGLLAADLGLSLSHAETLVKHHNKARDERREQFRLHVIRKLKEEDRSLTEIASRLNVSKQTVHRLARQIKQSEGEA